MESIERFAARYPFPLDDFQRRAIEGLALGESVLVAAPTGSGKTVVAEYAVEHALEGGRKAFYTTPLKALSNQKFGDFVARYGASKVGLLTGDNSINSEAQVVVMTTEVLRNMLYEQSPTLTGLQYVVLDEVHYLQDPYRGAVWEEILIHLPLSVSVVCLSATVSNAEEFGEWIGTLRGTTRVVIEERRPVPLEHLYLVGSDLLPIHVERGGELFPNPKILALEREELRRRRDLDRGRYVRRSRVRGPRREEVVEVLDRAEMLPAIYFVFSRAGCSKSVEWMMQAGIRLTTSEEEARVREFADMRAATIPEEDLEPLGFYEFREGLAAGVASHHAGMLPIFKETVEELFAGGYVKVVFATETLSLGINMPARTVVIEDLWKFSGERHELLTAGQYTQLTGRAGRRGIDEYGYAVVPYQRQVNFEQVASLATRRTYELTSSFRPSYNMAVNLVRNYSPEEAHHLLNSSFAQFLVDRSVVSMERQLERSRSGLDGYAKNLQCDRGDFAEYWGLREQAARLRTEALAGASRDLSDRVREALRSLKPGDVILVPTAKRRGLAVVLSNRDGRPAILTQDRRYFRAGPREFDAPPAPVARVKLPASGSARSARYRRDLAAKLVTLDVKTPRSRAARPDPKAIARAEAIDRRAREHPCHGCPDRATHERWAERWSKLRGQVQGLEHRIRGRTDSLARQLDRVLGVLRDLRYVTGFELEPKGVRLCRIYGEGDLLVGEALDAGLFDELSGSELAALASGLVFESRERGPRTTEWPTQLIRDRFRAMRELWVEVRRAEQKHQVELVRELDPGFAHLAFLWAEGKPLETVLGQTEMAPGDFVRTCKQLLDLLRQIEMVAPGEVARTARAAQDGVNRGVVAYTGV
ncbi:MAG: DEAD/DEAH box helicase [Actinomycetota bacterium]